MTERIEEIYSILNATVAQLAPSDDQIISDNIKKAHTLIGKEMREQRWQTTPPTHRHDVLIRTADGRIGMGWFSQGENPHLNVEYLASRDHKPTLDEEIEARGIIQWKPLT